MEALLDNYTRVYPVYTWHAEEVMKVSRGVYRIIESKAARQEYDDAFEFLRKLHGRLAKLLLIFQESTSDIIYMSKDDRVLVQQVAEFVEKTE